jgi:hypothetical protein
MLTVKGTVLVQLQFFLGIPPILRGGIVPPLTFATLKRHQLNYLFLACHIEPLPGLNPGEFTPFYEKDAAFS